MNVRVCFLGLVFSLSAGVFAADSPTSGYREWKQAMGELKKDPSLVRLYTFEEKYGHVLRNEAPKEERGYGDLDVISRSPYGQSRERYYTEWNPSHQRPKLFPQWVEGRWPGKGALASGRTTRNVARSRFSGTKDGIFTIAAWVRLYGEGGTTPLLSNHTGYHPTLHKASRNSGWSISYQKAGQAPVGEITFKIGMTTAVRTVTAADFSAKAWHYLVCLYDGKEIRIYIDGKPGGSAPCPGVYKHPLRARGDSRSMSEYDLFGFDIGGRPANERFDVDEIAIYNRALPANEIQKIYETFRPRTGLAEQQARFSAQLKSRTQLEAIQMRVPSDTYGIFPRGNAIPISFTVPAKAGLSGSLQAKVKVTDLKGQVMLDRSLPLQAGGKTATATTEFATDVCGLYWIDLSLADAKGTLIKRIPEEYCVSVSVPLPAVKDVPLSAPLLSHNATLYPERALQGIRVDRDIRSVGGIWPAKDKVRPDFLKELFDWKRSKDFKLLYTIHLKFPAWAERAPGKKYVLKDMSLWAEYCRKLYQIYGDMVYAWEIENEPNASHADVPPEEYVEFLKVSYKAFKEVDPDAIVVGGAGCPGYLNYYDKVFKAGGAKYFDVLSLHNYCTFPIKTFKEEHRIQKAKDLLMKYRGELVPIWNSESGFQNIVRDADGRPLMEDVMMRRHPRTRKKHGIAVLPLYMPTLTERQRADWQIQAILLDLAAGCDKYTLLASSHSYAPDFNSSRWQPTLLVPALAALQSVLIPSRSVEELPLSSAADAGAIITDQQGQCTAVLFSDKTPTLSFKVAKSGIYRGMDVNGNPKTWQVGADRILTARLSAEPCYIFGVSSAFQQVRFLTVSDVPEVLPENGMMNGKLTIRNPLTTQLKADLVPQPPTGCTLTGAATQIELAPGEAKSITFKLDGTSLKRRKYSLGFVLQHQGTELARVDYAFESEGVIQPIGKLKSPSADWWRHIKAETASEIVNVVHGTPVPGVPWAPQWRGPEDLSFTARMGWIRDGEILIRMDVRDNILMPSPNNQTQRSFLYDGVELFVDTRSKRSKLMGAGADQILIIPNTTEEVKDCVVWYGGKNKTHAVEAKVTGARSADGYWLEIRLRPTDASDFRLRMGSQFTFDLLVDDTDDEAARRKAAMTLHGVFNNAADPSKWGRYELAKTK
jgi:hypothetical protein